MRSGALDRARRANGKSRDVREQRQHACSCDAACHASVAQRHTMTHSVTPCIAMVPGGTVVMVPMG